MYHRFYSQETKSLAFSLQKKKKNGNYVLKNTEVVANI